MRAKRDWSCLHPSSGMQLALPRPITPTARSLPFTKSLATALDASSRAVGPESRSPGQVMGDTLPLSATAGCVAVSCKVGNLFKCPPSHTRRRLLDSTSARHFAAGALAVNLMIRDHLHPNTALGTPTGVPTMATASLAAQNHAPPRRRLCRCSFRALVEGGANPMAGLKLSLKCSSPTCKIPTVWFLAPYSTFCTLIRPLF